ncbi:hypothetical protein PNOK_0565800 [Pyrrhoderma noxium]|uniref:Uncharacterized protein n=1 Tax=Pyrrhoderma noxium TaxID=2282107 RepID=A0A286UH73_9AGAM|nr:hypothetical protein PNOK_0565800 [Pyrrhoderma noxium]
MTTTLSEADLELSVFRGAGRVLLQYLFGFEEINNSDAVVESHALVNDFILIIASRKRKSIQLHSEGYGK